MVDADNARREAFLWKVLEQFEGLSRWIAEPFHAEAWDAGCEVVLSISRDGTNEEVLRVAARFDDAEAERREFAELLSVTVEWQGEVTEMLTLGWRGTQPDIDRGLDSRADHSEGEYRVGKVVQALRDDIGVTLNLGTVPDRHSTTVAMRKVSEGGKQAADRDEPAAEAWKPAARRVEQHALAPKPDIGLLQTSLGELAEIGGLRAEKLFAGFIQAAGSRSPLTQGDVKAFLQGALLELFLFQEACLYGPSWMRPRTDRSDGGGALRDAVLAAKAVLYQGNDEVRRQVARELLAAMRITYGAALTKDGVAGEEIAAMVKSGFGNAATIVNEAVKGLSGSLSLSGEKRGRRLLPGNNLD